MVDDSYNKIFANKNRVLVIFSHPDDTEIYCGGTIARLTSDGKTVRVVKVTSGNKGSRQENISEKELASIRETEDANGLSILGVKPVDNISLGISDGSVENNHETIGLLARQIRLFKPDLIITHNPEDVIIRYSESGNYINHRDHRNTGLSAVDAAYPYGRDLLFFPEHLKEEGAQSHSVTEFLFVDYWDHPDNIYINVNKFLETRTRAISSHTSQYSKESAQESTDFFTTHKDAKGFEKFRHVIAD